MPALTRRKSSERHDTRFVYYDGVQVDSIGVRASVPVETDRWGWSCGFYPGLEPYDHQDGILLELTDGDLKAWRDHQPTMTAWKYEMHDRGLPMPTQRADSQSRCFCGVEITTHNVNQHILATRWLPGSVPQQCLK